MLPDTFIEEQHACVMKLESGSESGTNHPQGLQPSEIFEKILTKHLNKIYLNINQLDALNFIMSLFHASTCFEHVLIVRRSKLYYKASGIITLKQVSGLKLLKYNSISMNT